MTFEEAKEQAAQSLGFKPYIASLAYREWMAKSAELYARSKWDEACHAQKQACHFVTSEEPNFIRLRIDNAPKPEFKP